MCFVLTRNISYFDFEIAKTTSEHVMIYAIRNFILFFFYFRNLYINIGFIHIFFLIHNRF